LTHGYNLFGAGTVLYGTGANNFTNADPGFVSPTRGLYWLSASSDALNNANLDVHGPVDFFGNVLPISYVNRDIGFVQHNAAYDGDQRDLETTNYPNFWEALEATPITTYYAHPTGLGTYSGTNAANATTLQDAIVKAGVGGKVILLDGTYNLASAAELLSGQTVIASNKWKAVITCSTGPGVNINADSVVLDGLKVADCGDAFTDNTSIFLKGVSNTVRNCWVTNSYCVGITANDSGSSEEGNVFENNLVEWCGARDPQKGRKENPGLGGSGNRWHGIYVSGKNSIIRNNVSRHNVGSGIQIYSGHLIHVIDGIRLYNNLLYGNAYTNHLIDPAPDGWNVDPENHNELYLYASSGFNSYVFCNTVIGIVECGPGNWYITNNIITGRSDFHGWDPIKSPSGISYGDYNLFTSTRPTYTGSGGAHDKIGGGNFVSTAGGLYWLTAATGSTTARSNALSTVYGPVDFFGREQARVDDIGFVQYTNTLAGDTRNLETTNYPDFWDLSMTVPTTPTWTFDFNTFDFSGVSGVTLYLYHVPNISDPYFVWVNPDKTLQAKEGGTFANGIWSLSSSTDVLFNCQLTPAGIEDAKVAGFQYPGSFQVLCWGVYRRGAPLMSDGQHITAAK